MGKKNKTSSNLIKNTETKKRPTWDSHASLIFIYVLSTGVVSIENLILTSLSIKCHTGECYVGNNNGNKVIKFMYWEDYELENDNLRWRN